MKLTEVTKNIAAGDLTQRVGIKREVEIGILTYSFNVMAKSLDEKTRQIADCKRIDGERFISESTCTLFGSESDNPIKILGIFSGHNGEIIFIS